MRVAVPCMPTRLDAFCLHRVLRLRWLATLHNHELFVVIYLVKKNNRIYCRMLDFGERRSCKTNGSSLFFGRKYDHGSHVYNNSTI